MWREMKSARGQLPRVEALEQQRDQLALARRESRGARDETEHVLDARSAHGDRDAEPPSPSSRAASSSAQCPASGACARPSGAPGVLAALDREQPADDVPDDARERRRGTACRQG